MEVNFTRKSLEKLDKSQLIDIILYLKKEIDDLKKHIGYPKKTSTNSSKPPSTDFKSNKPDKKNKGGAKKGHKPHKRTLRKPDKKIFINIDKCPNCGLKHSSESKNYTTHQILELENIVIKVIEINRQRTTCFLGYKDIIATNPPGVFDNDNFGPKLKSFILTLYFEHKMSYSRISELISDLSGVKINKSHLINLIRQSSNNLNSQYEKLKEEIKSGDVVGIDETGWRVDGKNFWLWVFQNGNSVLYTIDSHRSGKVARDIIGDDYKGFVVSDFYSAYNKVYSRGKQKCLSHLLRSLYYVDELTGEEEGGFANNLIKLLHRGIHLKHSTDFNSDEYMSEKSSIEIEFDKLISVDRSNDDEQRIIKRLRKYRNDIFLFLNYPKVPATNNSSERAIRGRVIHRKICNGSKSLKGKDSYSILSSIIETFKKQGLNIYQSLIELFKKSSMKEPRLKLNFITR
jgi:transposase